MSDGIGPVFRASLAQDQGDIVSLRGLRVGEFHRVPLGTGEAAGEQHMGNGQGRVGGHLESVA